MVFLSGSKDVQIFYGLFIYVLKLEIQLSRKEGCFVSCHVVWFVQIIFSFLQKYIYLFDNYLQRNLYDIHKNEFHPKQHYTDHYSHKGLAGKGL